MKTARLLAISLLVLCLPHRTQAQYHKAAYVSLPGPGDVQHLAYLVAKERKFYDEAGLPNVQIVVLMRDAWMPALSAEGVMKRAEMEFAILKQRPNFNLEQFMDDRFYKAAVKALAREAGGK